MNARIRAIEIRTLAGLLLICAPAVSSAVELTNQTLQAWQDYIGAANLRMEEHLHGRLPFPLG